MERSRGADISKSGFSHLKMYSFSLNTHSRIFALLVNYRPHCISVWHSVYFEDFLRDVFKILFKFIFVMEFETLMTSVSRLQHNKM